jgi:hypothetical protein
VGTRQSTRAVPTRCRRGADAVYGGVFWGTEFVPRYAVTRYERGTCGVLTGLPRNTTGVPRGYWGGTEGVLGGTGGVPRGYWVLNGGLGIGQSYAKGYSRGIHGYSRGTLGVL